MKCIACKAVKCIACEGWACSEGCFPRCRHAYDGPDSHKVCRRCGGSGIERDEAVIAQLTGETT